jgi:hypothetical protein
MEKGETRNLHLICEIVLGKDEFYGLPLGNGGKTVIICNSYQSVITTLLYILQVSADQIEAAEKFKDEYSLTAGIKC